MININFGKLKRNKDNFIKYLHKNKIIVQQHYIPIYKFSIYKKKFSLYKGSEKYYKNSISIPIYFGLNQSKQDKVIKIIKSYF